MHIQEKCKLLSQPKASNEDKVEGIIIVSSTFQDDSSNLTVVISLGSGKMLDEPVLMTIIKQVKLSDDSTWHDKNINYTTLSTYKSAVS